MFNSPTHRAEGYDCELLPGTVILRFPDGEIHFVWEVGAIVEKAYKYMLQVQAG
jgi:hypothetical protein